MLHKGDPLECARPRALAQPQDPLIIAAATLRGTGVHLVDLTDRFCDAQSCYAVVGGIPVYYNADHLNLEYVRMLAPMIEASLGTSGAATR